MQQNYDVTSDLNVPWNELSGCAVLVTGATGLIGGVLVRALSAANDEHCLNMRLIAHGRNSGKCESLVKEFGIEAVCGDIRMPSPLADISDRFDYIFHCAAITKSADMVSKPADVINTAFEGTKNMLELARARRCRSFVYLSSMEIYGQISASEVTERDLGYLDLSSPRSSYPESKRLCETLCAAYTAQYGLSVKIARLSQTFGAGTPIDDTRVFAQFGRSAIAGADIELHTEGCTRGNYCDTSDAIRGLLTILLKGKAGEAYNIANPDASATIREMAELVADNVCGGKIKTVVNIPADIQKYGYAPGVEYRLNADKLKVLGWIPRYGLVDMYRRMLADWHVPPLGGSCQL